MNARLRKKAQDAGVADRIILLEAKAHDTGIGEHKVDLITVGTAAHWLATSDHAKEIPTHWKKILKPNRKAAIFYVLPSPEDPVVKAVHDALTGPEASEKYPHLAPAYQNAAFFGLSDWEKVDRYAQILVDQTPGRTIPRIKAPEVGAFWRNYKSDDARGPSFTGLGYAMQEMVPATPSTHPVEGVLGYFRTFTPTQKIMEEHPEEGKQLADHVKDAVKNAEAKPLQWACRVYLGEPRVRPLSHAEQIAPTSKTRGHGVFPQ